MAVLHKKEEKIQAVLGRLPKKYTPAQFVELFIQLYSKDWGKIKAAYIKQSQDKEPGTVVNMPKPALYLEQVLASYLAKNTQPQSVTPEVVVEELVELPAAAIKKAKAPAKKKEAESVPSEAAVETVAVKKAKAPAKKKEVETDALEIAKPKKATVKKKVEGDEKPVSAKKSSTVAKKAAVAKK